MKDARFNVGKMVRLAVLVAIIIVMANTPLGFLPIGPVTITLLPIPVAIAAIAVGPTGGAIAGAVFGLTAFLRGFGINMMGPSWLAAVLINSNLIFAFIVLVVTRMFVGLIPGLLYKALNEKKGKTFATLVACLAAPLTNTVLFLGTLVLLFGNAEFYTAGGTVTTGLSIAVGALIVVNILIEVGFGFITGSAISRTLIHFFPGKTRLQGDKKKAVV